MPKEWKNITNPNNLSSFTIPEGTYEGTDFAYTSKGNIIQPKEIKLIALILKLYAFNFKSFVST